MATNKTKSYLIIAVVALLIPSGIYFWQQHKMSKLKDGIEIEQQAFRDQLTTKFDASQERNMALVMQSMVWAARSEMLRENYEQVAMYLEQLSKNEQIQNATITGSNGTVMHSSNRDMEGKAITEYFPEASVSADEIKVNTEKDYYIATAPVMGLSKKLGVLVLVIQRDSL